MPNFMYYYWSANIQKLLFWFHTVITSWGTIESKSCLGTSLSALLCSPLPTVVSKHTKNPIVLASLKIWYQFRRHFKFLSSSILAPKVGNHLFPPALDASFSFWKVKGINCFLDLYENCFFQFYRSNYEIWFATFTFLSLLTNKALHLHAVSFVSLTTPHFALGGITYIKSQSESPYIPGI